GEKVVKMNWDAVDSTLAALKEVKYPAEWANAADLPKKEEDVPEFVKKVLWPMAAQKGDTLPVSAFTPDGTFPMAMTQYEKRRIAINVPEWQPEKCIQCNMCSFVCPHAVIRPFVAKPEDLANAPKEFVTIDAQGKELKGMKFRIQVSVRDCTGCGNCADVCPGKSKDPKDKALIMKPLASQEEVQHKNWEFAMKLPPVKNPMNKYTIKGSQFERPLFEFSGACAGCGETPYIKVLTQLFGDRMMIANATGCSSIYGGTAPSNPYCINHEGKGPAWANSLFEDNAEYGYGMMLGMAQRRKKLKESVEEALKAGVPEDVKGLMEEWLKNWKNGDMTKEIAPKLEAALAKYKDDKVLGPIYAQKDLFIKKSVWVVGGDGWAYDIGYGGLDHVLASNEDIKMLVLDTEVYSNTGGQSSKASPVGAVARFAYSGKKTIKKDLGRMAMTYGYVYVASVAMGANMQQYVKALQEAENYPGPALIIAYSPCINHGIKAGMGKSQYEEKLAVETGYWILYRYNPLLALEGKNPLVLDSKEPNGKILDFLSGEDRYKSLAEEFPEEAKRLAEEHQKFVMERWKQYQKMAQM
ncbi:MAG: thiamine pyrophosphate-dependent enzyme, partial [Thermoplasmata archaeon]